jgi:adiponectin receptor
MVYDCLKSGYRIGFNSLSKILKSIFMIHNETVNIWSHLLGAIGFIAFVVLILAEVISLETNLYHKDISMLGDSLNLPQIPRQDLLAYIPSSSQTSPSEQLSVAPLLILLMSSSLCLLCSAAFHIFYPVSPSIFKMSLSLDFAGISINFAGNSDN